MGRQLDRDFEGAARLRAGSTALVVAGISFAAVVAFHNSDHARRGGDSVSTDVLAIGTFAILLELVVIALAVGRHRLGPLLAATSGFALAAGYLLVHFTPQRGFLSDSLIEGPVDSVTVVAGVLETIVAFALAFAGLAAMRRADGLASAAVSSWRDEWRSAKPMFLHPVVLAFTAVNAAGLVVTFSTL